MADGGVFIAPPLRQWEFEVLHEYSSHFVHSCFNLHLIRYIFSFELMLRQNGVSGNLFHHVRPYFPDEWIGQEFSYLSLVIIIEYCFVHS